MRSPTTERGGRVRGRLVARSALDPPEIDRMYRLLDRHFLGVSPTGFGQDLAEKDWVVLLEAEPGTGDGGVPGREEGPGVLVGFTTFRLDRERCGGREITVVFSGDTIVDPKAWGSPALPRTWIRSVRSLHERHGTGSLWWLLIASGFRTFRFLPVFCRTFHAGPRGTPATGRSDDPAAITASAATDTASASVPGTSGTGREADDLGGMAARLASRRFGARYDPVTGIVRLARPQRLREPLLDVPEGRLEDPWVRRFLRLNPGHADGDELVCLARLDDDNLTRAGRRMLYGRDGGARP